MVPVGIEYGKHVRVDRGRAALAAEKSEGEADHLVLIESPYENIACRFQGDGQSERQGVIVGHAPNFPFDRLQLIEIVDAVEIADRNRLCSAGHHGWPFVRFELSCASVAISARVLR